MQINHSPQLREDGSLPLDLWKTQSAKDTISLPRSDIIQHFANQLLHKSELNEDAQTFTIDKVSEIPGGLLGHCNILELV